MDIAIQAEAAHHFMLRNETKEKDLPNLHEVPNINQQDHPNSKMAKFKFK